MLYDDFKPIVDMILNNWTALQLAVEHGMGAPGGEKVMFISTYLIVNLVPNTFKAFFKNKNSQRTLLAGV